MESTTDIRLSCSAQEAELVTRLFLSEDKVLSNKRASYEIKTLPQGLLFCIKAKDSTALRAILSVISKTLSIFEKTQELCLE